MSQWGNEFHCLTASLAHCLILAKRYFLSEPMYATSASRSAGASL